MNKISIVFLISIIIVALGVFFGSKTARCEITGKTVTIDMIVGSWYFDPETIRVECGDNVILKVYNEDNYDHGVGLDLFGINKRLVAKSTTKIEFMASQEGTFSFYCTVPCGSGVDKITGLPKGHFEQKGMIIIE